MSICPNTPHLGGNGHKASKFCCDHKDLNDEQANTPILNLDSDPENVKLGHLIPEQIKSDQELDAQQIGDGCRKKSNVNHYLDRTAGVAAIVRPCGIILSVTEMYTCESMTQMYLFSTLKVSWL